MEALKMRKGTDVVLRNAELLRRRQENRKYLLELESWALLLPYQLEAGRCVMRDIPEGMHRGWESPVCELRGHILGHWLSAAAMCYEATGDLEVRGKADAIVAELAACQKDNGGQWAASIPEKYLYWIAQGRKIWAPQYTVHKTFMGLVDMYRMAGNEQALEVADHFADWFYEWSGRYSREAFQKILNVETGGMLEIWALLYGATGKEKYRVLMERYRRDEFFRGLQDGRDILTNMHANTTIPEILGAAAAYEVTGDEKWLEAVKAYWKMAVDERGTYATGGQTCGEIWSAPQKLAGRLGDKTQEHCSVYNMMRLADFLFRHTADCRYADYWEKNLYNGILAQGYWEANYANGYQSMYPTKGLLTYYLPLRAGARKGWASKKGDFFCCHGTLMQANAAHNTGIYYEGEGRIYICQYLDSDFEGKGFCLRLRRDWQNGLPSLSDERPEKIREDADRYSETPRQAAYDLEVEADEETELEICVRIPGWTKGEAHVLVQDAATGETKSYLGTPGHFLKIRRKWRKAVLHLEFPKEIRTELLPGSRNMTAFLDGPVLLAGLCREERMLHTGGRRPEELLVPDGEREWEEWMGTYKTVGQDNGIRFIPLYRVGYERYAVYFPVEE